MKRDLRIPSAVLVVFGAGATCTFPEIGFKNDSSGTGSGGTAAVSGAGGSRLSSSSASSSTGTAGALPCGDAGPCDCDGDGDRSSSPACGGGDCDDHDPLVSSKQTQFFTAPGSHGWDYNCSNKSEYEIQGVLKCPDATLLACDTTTVRWHGSVPDCGELGQLGTCQGTLSFCSENIMGSKPQGCH